MSVLLIIFLSITVFGDVLAKKSLSTEVELDVCFESWYKNLGVCQDYQKLIDCYKRVIVRKDDEENAKFKAKHLKYLETKLAICPAALDKGSCLKAEINKCRENTDKSDCKSVAKTKNCLVDLQTTCNTTVAHFQIEEVRRNLVCSHDYYYGKCSWRPFTNCFAENFLDCPYKATRKDGKKIWVYPCKPDYLKGALDCANKIEPYCESDLQRIGLMQFRNSVKRFCKEHHELFYQVGPHYKITRNCEGISITDI